MSVRNTTFIKGWLSNTSSEQLAKRFKMSPSGLYAKANYLRRKGVALPNRPSTTGRQKIDVNELNQLIKDIG